MLLSILLVLTLTGACGEASEAEIVDELADYIKEARIDQALISVENRMNDSCPRVFLDGDARLDSVTISKGRVMTYFATLFDFSSEVLGRSEFRKELKQRYLRSLDKNDSSKLFKEFDITMVLVCSDENGNLLLELKITPDEYD